MCPWRDLALIVHQGRIYDRYAKRTRTIGCLQAPTANRSGTCCRVLLGPVSKQQREFGGLPQSPRSERLPASLGTTALALRPARAGLLQRRRRAHAAGQAILTKGDHAHNVVAAIESGELARDFRPRQLVAENKRGRARPRTGLALVLGCSRPSGNRVRPGACWDHRDGAFVDRVDDLGVVDPT